MPAEPPPEPRNELVAPGAPAGSAAPVPATGVDVIETERQLNSPTPLTLRLLGVIFIATFLPWAGAKIACNQRESPVRQPLDLPTDVLAKTPKGAALELQQRAATSRYAEAAELAKAEAAQDLLAADARCKSDPQPCEQRRAQSGKIFSRVVVLSRGPAAATVRAESELDGKPVDRVAMRLVQEEGRWYVTARTPYAGEMDAPVAPEDVVSPISIREVSGPERLFSPHGTGPHGSPPQGSPAAAGPVP